MPARHITELVAEACGLVEHVTTAGGATGMSAAAAAEELQHLRALLQALSYQTLSAEASETARSMVADIDEALARLARDAAATERIAG